MKNNRNLLRRIVALAGIASVLAGFMVETPKLKAAVHLSHAMYSRQVSVQEVSTYLQRKSTTLDEYQAEWGGGYT